MANRCTVCCNPRPARRWLAVFALMAVFSASAQPAPQLAQADAEIGALLASLGQSNCQFYRNGTWHEGARAADHLKRKFEYLQRKGRITDADRFIADAATQSSLSGEAYQVRCAAKPAEPSADWLQRKLEQLRSENVDRPD